MEQSGWTETLPEKRGQSYRSTKGLTQVHKNLQHKEFGAEEKEKEIHIIFTIY